MGCSAFSCTSIRCLISISIDWLCSRSKVNNEFVITFLSTKSNFLNPSFQACKSIETSLLQGCGPVDYSCQCNAQVGYQFL